jgi:peptide-methionine (S)-S-oxide reductase
MPLTNKHAVNTSPLLPPFPAECEKVLFGMGCFWGAEKRFWSLPGVYTTAVGYAAGHTVNPTYEQVCTGLTGHSEVVLLVYNPKIISFFELLSVFWESHNPTQGMRQGNDRGTQYRSGVYYFTEAQLQAAQETKTECQSLLNEKGFGAITTEILPAPEFPSQFFFYAEDYHQQYLYKNPHGYCGLGGTGICLTRTQTRSA